MVLSQVDRFWKYIMKAELGVRLRQEYVENM